MIGLHDPSRQWVNDDCERDYIPDMDRARAEGISKIHGPCTPPCPRAIAAREFLVHNGLPKHEHLGKRE